MKPGALIAKKFRLTRQIGEGAMGEVWAATNESTGGEFALKFILKSTKDLRERLMREARAAGGIRHPNVIEIHDVGETNEGDPFLVMPLLAGETLSELLARTRRLEVTAAARIGRDVARALAAAHAKQIIHRDLKPANIFLEQLPDVDEPIVRVLDFGVSKNLESSDGLSTMTGATVGSPAYMSPEQAKADRSIDPRADLWSLGVVLFETLTGVRPFQGDANQLIVQITTTEAPRLSRFLRHVDPALDALVARCLERDRNRRIGGAAELANELQRFTSAGQASAVPPSVAAGSAPNSGPISAPISGPINPPSPTPGFGRAPLGSRPDVDPATRSPRLDGLASVIVNVDDDDNSPTARLNPQAVAAAMQRLPQAPAPRIDATPQATPPMYAVTAPLSAFAQGAGPHPQYAQGVSASPAPPPPPAGRDAMGSGAFPRMASSPQIVEPPTQPMRGIMPMGVQPMRQPLGSAPIVPTPLHDTAPLGVPVPLVGQPLPGQVGIGASAGSAGDSDSGLEHLMATLPLVRDGGPGKGGAAAGPSPTSSTAALMRTPTVDPALGSGAGAMAERKRRRLAAVVVSLSVIAVGLAGVVVYNVVVGPSKPEETAKVEEAAPSAAAQPAATASVAAVEPSAVEAVPSAAPMVTEVVTSATTAPPKVAPTTRPAPVGDSPLQRPAVTASPRGTGAATTPKAGSDNLPPWLKPGPKVHNPKKP